MSLNSQIRTICETINPDDIFLFSSKFRANVQAHTTSAIDKYLIILDNELSKNSEIKKNNNVIKDTKIVISVLTLDKQDNTDQQSEDIRAACETIADRIAANIYQLIEVRPNGNQKYKIIPMFHVFASGLTGVAMEMQVNYNEIVNFSI